MLFLKYLLIILGAVLFGSAAGLVAYDVYLAAQLRRLLSRSEGEPGAATESAAPRLLAPRPSRPVRWRLAVQLGLASLLPFLLSQSIAVVPDGTAGVRISQLSGVRPGTVYPGVHVVVPLVDHLALYDTREQVYTAAASRLPKAENDVLRVQSREGLEIGLAVSVRYRLDPRKLDSIHANLPEPVDEQVVAPIISTIYRQLAPNYLVREIFATKREELRQKASDAITARLASDGIVVREILLRDIQLPAEYAKGLEGLLLKDQENEQLATVQEIKQKQVRIAELEAEAQKGRDIKQAEAQAQVRVLQAKAESDAMQYTLPLKQKQIEQTKLEAEARKQATLQNADAAAQAKVIDSRAEIERQKNLTEAEANRIRVTAAADAERVRVTAAADAERLRLEAAVLKQNPMLIQKIIAERLSDKLQILMVPTDGRNFFATDVFRSAFAGGANSSAGEDDPNDPPANATAQRRPNRKP